MSPGGVVLLCDGKELIKIEKNVFFQITMPTGAHSCNFKRSAFSGTIHDIDPVPIVVEPGSQYFLKVDYGGFGASLKFVDRQQAEPVIRRMRPVNLGDIKDSSVSSINELP